VVSDRRRLPSISCHRILLLPKGFDHANPTDPALAPPTIGVAGLGHLKFAWDGPQIQIAGGAVARGPCVARASIQRSRRCTCSDMMSGSRRALASNAPPCTPANRVIASSWGSAELDGLLVRCTRHFKTLVPLQTTCCRRCNPHALGALGAQRGSRGGLVVDGSSRVPHRVRDGDLPIRRWKAKITPSHRRRQSCKLLPRESNDGARIAAVLSATRPTTDR
jgi:hypothetical protein